MKKFLITGGVLFSILPAMALQLTDVIEPNDNGDCSGENFQSNSVSMQAVYVTETCPAGYYFDVSANAAIDSTTGIVTGASCQPCTDGYYCPSTVTVAANNGALNTQGRTQCPAGTYGNATDRGTIPSDTNDPDYNTILANYTACQACSGATYASNTGSTSCTSVTQGWYADKVNSNDPGNTTQTQCPFGYRAIAAASQGDCTKTVNSAYCNSLDLCSNFNNIVTEGNNACTTSINSNNNNIVNGSITFSSQNTDPVCLATFKCAPGYEQKNPYQWIIDNSERLVSYSNCSIDGQHGTSCSTMERGTLEWNTAANDTRAPFRKIHLVAKCSGLTPTGGTYHVSGNTPGFNTDGTICWLKVVDFPDQDWFIAGAPSQSQAECEATCGVTMASDTYPFGDIDSQTNQYAAAPNAFVSLSAMATLTANDSEAENSNVKICVANTITINWGDIADPGDAGTCTYGEDFTAPQSGPNPADHPGLKFLGWKLIPTNNNNNN